MHLQNLLKECKRNNITAQKAVYDHFANSMFLVCRRYVGDDETAEEMMMNGFLKFFQSVTGFKYVNEAATVGWVKKIMVNECLMQLRRTNSFLQLISEESWVTGENDDVISQMSAEEIYRLITQLPPGYKTVFNLSVMEDLSHKEIAAMLNISEATSRSQLSKAKQMLRHLIINNNSDHAWRKTK